MTHPTSPVRLASVLLTSLLLSLTACGDDDSPGPDAGSTPDASTRDAGTDAGTPPDAGLDAGADTGIDAGVDAGTDAGVDAGTDTGTDAGTGTVTDAGTDAGTDTGMDAGTDAGTSTDAGTRTDAGTTARCGDGVGQPPETCDDGNVTPGDGCNASCEEEPGWNCPQSGGRCHAARCGDSFIAGDEECEDGNAVKGDGCNELCRLEDGYKCPNIGQPCQAITCGDGKVEGTEQCDDGPIKVHDMGDGCSPTCKKEPACTDGVCTSVCGDGVMLPNSTDEECDDGNTRANDGCSPTCKLEDGFACTVVTEAPPELVSIPTVYRDFRGYDLQATSTLPRGHIDFENGNISEKGIVATLLGADGKPVYAKEGASSTTTHGKDAFAQWYRDVDRVNRSVVDSLELTRQPDGSYVFDSGAFFPLDGKGWVATGDEPARNDGHNFSFTSEARYWFEYKGTEVLTFRGDDDVWVFINKKLALDLGGVHGAQEDSIHLSQKASELGLQVGGIYEAVVFQAERHTVASSYRLTLNNFATRRTVCVATCGNRILDRGEECDDGVNDGGYGQCARGCVWGPRCGDGINQSEDGEECDDGNTTSKDGCSATCKVELG
ncbi:DUF4215 domain-containing protein [Pyxidicoccus parkwayensis]|uniref:DUF4215 domain-containing protein n=1 Tax=Pyxidicoccus parkwayensis TaxID=2813578 RepID=A0ABX7NRW3_9BACT|nr:DUF4215 domain-containing protein [Pyxidicoccus parkwaysis]QSQ21630.1 DUF4215 domain-containing protein [Pyxidicoccus parkwaysis]